MAKRGDNIHKRKDGRWEGRYKQGRTGEGVIKYGSVYGKTYREVKDKLTTILCEATKPVILKGPKMTLGEVLSLWMTNNRIRLKGGTINKYQSLIDTQIVPELGAFPITEIDSTVINSFLDRKLSSGRIDGSGGLAPSYVRSIMLVISAALKFAIAEQICLPFRTPISKPTITKQDIPILSPEEQKITESHLLCDLDLTKAGILLSLYAGLRIGEICALSWDDIDLKKMIIKVRHTVARIRTDGRDSMSTTKLIIDTPKTKASTRDIPISSALLPILIQIRSVSSTGFVISETDTFVNPRTFEYRYHRILNECGVASVNFHALRHTFATRCIEAGVDIKSLSEILGHANVGVTLNTYVHSSMEMKRSQLEKLTTTSAYSYQRLWSS